MAGMAHRGERRYGAGKSATALVALTVERRVFPDTQITAYRLAA